MAAAVTMVRCVLLALVVALSGCRTTDLNVDGTLEVGCLGDSNTTAHAVRIGWCEQAAPLLPAVNVWKSGVAVLEPTAFANVGVSGATLCDPGIPYPWAGLQLASVPSADVIVAAFVTNDVVGLGHTPAEIVACAQAIVVQAAPRPVLIALAPPVFGAFAPAEPAIEAANAALRTAFLADHIVDFWTGFTVADFADGFHLTTAGQAKRAAIVVTALASL